MIIEAIIMLGSVRAINYVDHEPMTESVINNYIIKCLYYYNNNYI